MRYYFEWDPQKAKINFQKHKSLLKGHAQFLKIPMHYLSMMKNIVEKKIDGLP